MWLNHGPCIRLRPEHPDHVWSCGFVVDEFAREWLAIDVESKLNSEVVLDGLARLGVGTLHMEPGGPWDNGYVGAAQNQLLACANKVQALVSSGRLRVAVVEIKFSLAMAVRKARKQRNWTQAHLATVLRTKQPNVARMERGDATIDMLAKSLVALGVNRRRVGELVAG